MKKVKSIAVLCCFAMILCLAACGKKTNVKPGEDAVYCLNESKTGLVKVAFDMPDGTVLEQVQAVLDELAKPSEEIEYIQVLPKEVCVNSYTMQNVILNLDMNKEYLELPPIQEKLVRIALVRSLLQISGVQGVWITVDKQPLREEDGTVVGVLNEDDFVENVGSSVGAYQKTTLTLYFANQSGDKLVEEKVNVHYSANIPIEKIIVEKLMHGPKHAGAYPTINPTATLLSVTVKDGVCYVNFDSEYMNSSYNVKPEVAVYSLVNSLLEGTTAGKVQIAVNGVTDVKYKDVVDLSQAFQQNLDLLEKQEEK